MKLQNALTTAAASSQKDVGTLLRENVSIGNSLAYLTEEEYAALNGKSFELTGKSQMVSFTPENEDGSKGTEVTYPSLQVKTGNRNFKVSLNSLVSNFDKEVTAETEISKFAINMEQTKEVSDFNEEKFRTIITSIVSEEA